MPSPLLRIHPADNVAVALQPLVAGQTVALENTAETAMLGGPNALAVTLANDIPRGHKVALVAIPTGSNVVKYGFPIGHATRDIAPGGHVHTQNLKTNLSGTLEYSYRPEPSPASPLVEPIPAGPTSGEVAANALQNSPTFQGYPRPNGEVGIRNELWIIPTVGCVNHIAEALARRFNERLASDKTGAHPAYGTIEGAHAFTHPYGCSQLGDDHATTQRLLASLAWHPNAGGVLLVGLGCENNTMASFQEALKAAERETPKDASATTATDSAASASCATVPDAAPSPNFSTRFRFLVAQQEEDELACGLRLLDELAAAAGQTPRQPVPAAALRVGLKCGGSDGFSGITGNPLVGAFSDRLIALGGASLLTEVPEMFGAETILMNRCVSRPVFDACVAMINGFKDYFLRHGQVVYENPSPGNKDGGISTLEEKSLGCTQKGGSGAVVDVLDYGARLRKAGLSLLNGPGNDIVAVTALAAAGAHLVLFTTGRGTPLGGPVPTVKIATNSDLAARKRNWIDFDAGRLLTGTPMPALAGELFAQILQTASGTRPTQAEQNGFREIAIFKDGVTL